MIRMPLTIFPASNGAGDAVAAIMDVGFTSRVRQGACCSMMMAFESVVRGVEGGGGEGGAWLGKTPKQSHRLLPAQ